MGTKKQNCNKPKQIGEKSYHMQYNIYICDKRKLVMIYIASHEVLPAGYRESLKPFFDEWKEKGYLPVIFESGTENIEDGLYLLLKRNMISIAKDVVRYNRIIQQ